MRRLACFLSAALFLSAATVFTTGARAQDAADPVVVSYVLTMDKLNRYFTAALALDAAVKSDPALAAEQEAAEAEPSDTIAQLRATVAKYPKLYAFFQRQGLTLDDAILLPFAVLNAQIFVENGVSVNGTPNQAQINFVRQNKDAIEQGFAKLNN